MEVFRNHNTLSNGASLMYSANKDKKIIVQYLKYNLKPKFIYLFRSFANYNIRAFKDYAKLNEERKIILDAIERDGRIYGWRYSL